MFVTLQCDWYTQPVTVGATPEVAHGYTFFFTAIFLVRVVSHSTIHIAVTFEGFGNALSTFTGKFVFGTSVCAVQFIFSVDTISHSIAENVTIHTVCFVQVSALELAHLTFVFTSLFVTSVSAVHVVVTSILHFDTIACAVAGEFVVLADSAVFAGTVEFAVYTGTVQTVFDNSSAFGPFLSIVETWAVLGQNASLISLYVSFWTEASLHTLGIVTVRLRLIPDIPTRLGAGRGAGGVAESILTHDGTNFLAPPFYRISGLVTALGKVSYGCTETFTVSSAVTSAGVEKTVGVVSVDYCICEELPAGLEDVAVDDTTRFLRPLFSVGQFSGARDNFRRSADGRYWTTGRGSPTVGEVHGCSFTSVDLFVLINGITVIVSTQSFNSALPDWFQENVHTGTSIPQNGDVFTGSVDRRPEALFGDDDVAQFVDIPCSVNVVFPADQVDFLAFDGDLDGFCARHVCTTALDVLRDDLETLVLSSGQNVGAYSLEGE